MPISPGILMLVKTKSLNTEEVTPIALWCVLKEYTCMCVKEEYKKQTEHIVISAQSFCSRSFLPEVIKSSRDKENLSERKTYIVFP